MKSYTIKRTQHNSINININHHYLMKIHLYFFIVTMIICSVFFISGKLRFGDLFFNYFRFREVGLDIIHGQYPQFNFFTGTILGGATSTFYPWLTILPFIPLMHWLSPLSWWVFLIGFGFMLGFEIAYFTSRTIQWSRRMSFIFANLYVLSLIAVDYVYFGNDIGGFYSMMLAPLVFFGWWYWINKNRWYMMTIGLLLIGFTHIITVVILIMMMCVLTLLFINQVNKSKLISLIKAILVSIGSTTILWLPMMIIMKTNQIYTPSEFPIPWLQRPLLIKPLSAYLNFYGDNSLSIVDALALILLVINWRKVSLVDKKFASVAILFMLTNFQPIAKWLVVNTLFSNFQFMHRFCFGYHFLFSVVLIDILRILIQQHNWSFVRKFVYPVIAFMILMILGAGHLYLLENNQKPTIHITSVRAAKPVIQKKGNLVVNQTNLTKPIFWHVLMNTYADYYPQQDVKIHKINNMIAPQIRIPMLNNTNYTKSGDLLETVKHHGIYTLPIVIYHHQKYTLRVNSHIQKIRTADQYVKVTLHPGRNIIHLNTPMMWYRYLAIIISILSIVWFGYTFYEDEHKF